MRQHFAAMYCVVAKKLHCICVLQTMQASKRNAVPSAMVARQSLNDEELVSTDRLSLAQGCSICNL